MAQHSDRQNRFAEEPEDEIAIGSTPIRVAIFDDHPMLCAGLAASFSGLPDFELVGVGSTAEEAIELAGRVLPHVMIIDLNMPGDGLNAVAKIATDYPAIKIVVLTAYSDEYYLTQSIRAGASGFILKGIAADELNEIVRNVVRGQIVVSPMAGEAPTEAVEDQGLPRTLTAREQDIITLVARGLTNAEVAEELGLSEGTVRNYMTSLMQKLNVRNRVEAAIQMNGIMRRN